MKLAAPDVRYDGLPFAVWDRPENRPVDQSGTGVVRTITIAALEVPSGMHAARVSYKEVTAEARVASRRFQGKDLRLVDATAVEVHEARVDLYKISEGGFVGTLTVDAVVDRGSLPLLLRDSFWYLHPSLDTCHDKPPLAFLTATAGGPARASDFYEVLHDLRRSVAGMQSEPPEGLGPQRSFERRQVLLTNDPTLFADDSGEVDLRYLQRLLRRSDLAYEGDMRSLVLPPAANQLEQTAVVVRGGLSLLIRPPKNYARFALASSILMTWARRLINAVQGQATALAQSDALDASVASPSDLRALASRLTRLNVEFAAEVAPAVDIGLEHSDMAAVDYHRALATDSGLAAGMNATAALLDRLNAAAASSRLNAELQLVAAVNTQTHATRLLAFTASAVGAVVAGVGLYATIAAVPKPEANGTLLRPALLPAGIAMAAILAAVIAALGFRAVASHRSSQRQRAGALLISGLGLSASACFLGRFLALSAGQPGWFWAAVTAFLVAALAYAAGHDFEADAPAVADLSSTSPLGVRRRLWRRRA